MPSPKGLPYDSIVMRELGQSYSDKGFFEVNLASGAVEWANEFVLSKYGMTLEQLQAMTIYDLVPTEHHDAVTSSIADESRGRSQKFSIWPGKTASGKLVWWYVTKAKSAHPFHWYKAEYLNITDKIGPEYTSMLASMSTAATVNDLASRLLDHQEWTQGEVNRLDDGLRNLQQGQAEMQEQLKGCLAAANRAANEAVQANTTISHLKDDMENQFAKQTTEILRLISTDTVHEQRMSKFEDSMKKAATEAANSAIRQIAASAEKAGKAITVQAHHAGQGLARKVTVPVGVIAAVATLVQWIINYLGAHH
jgi:LysM repeat protein